MMQTWPPPPLPPPPPPQPHVSDKYPLNEYIGRIYRIKLQLRYTVRIHSYCTPSTQLEYTITAPSVHNYNTLSLLSQYTARLHSHRTRSTLLQHIVTAPKCTARIHGHCTPSTHLEYIFTTSTVHS